MDETPKGWFISLIMQDPLEQLSDERRIKRAKHEKVCAPSYTQCSSRHHASVWGCVCGEGPSMPVETCKELCRAWAAVLGCVSQASCLSAGLMWLPCTNGRAGCC